MCEQAAGQRLAEHCGQVAPWQGLKPDPFLGLIGTTKVMPCYKALAIVLLLMLSRHDRG